MRSYLFLVVLLMALGLSSCQCADPPPVGQVEEANDSATQQDQP